MRLAWSLLLIAAVSCARESLVQIDFPPGAERGTEILVVTRASGSEAYVVALEQRSIVFPFRWDDGEAITLEAMIYAETPGALGLQPGPLAEPAPGGPPLSPEKMWSLALEGGEASGWSEAAISDAARRFRPRLDAECVPLPEDECGAHDLSGLVVEPIAPREGLRWLTRFAENRDGVLLGLGDDVVVLFDRRARGAEPVTVLLPASYHQTAKTATALRSGDFIISGRKNHLLNDGHRFSRVELERDASGVLTGARITEIAARAPAVRPSQVAYVSASAERPLYMFGATPGSFSDSIFLACKDDATLDCVEDPLATQCQGFVSDTSPKAGVFLSNGIGVAVAEANLYFRPVDGAWACRPTGTRLYEFADRSAPAVGAFFRSIAAIGDRVFLCGDSDVSSCDAVGGGVVLSAEVSEATDPRFEIIARGASFSSCSGMFNVPGDPNRVRAVMSDRRTFDFDGEGRLIGTSTIGRAPRLAPIRTVLSSGMVIAGLSANVVQVSDGVQPFEQLYGATSTVAHPWRELLAYEDSFFAFTGASITRIDVTPGMPGAIPELRTRTLRDLFNTLGDQEQIEAAVLDRAATVELGVPVFVIGGLDRAANRSFLKRISVDDNQITGGEAIELDPPVTAMISHLAEIGEGRFVALAGETRVIEVRGRTATELPVDFDAINSPELEEVPVLTGCGGETFRASRWRAIAGGRCAAWAVGGDGMIARIAGGRVTRIVARTENASGNGVSVLDAHTAVDASCADRVMIGGSDVTFTYGIAASSSPADTCYPGGSVSEDIRALEVRAFPQGPELDCVNARAGPDINTWSTSRLLGDGTFGAALLQNGFIHRYRPDKPQGEDPRVPFYPDHAVQNARGYILFGGYDSQLAIGVALR